MSTSIPSSAPDDATAAEPAAGSAVASPAAAEPAVPTQAGAADADLPASAPGEQPLEDRGSNRSQRPSSPAFREFIASSWGEEASGLPERSEVADHAAGRRARVGALFPGERLVVPAGALVVRSNDTDYRFRAHSAFVHLTGLAAEAEPDAVLVLHPVAPDEQPADVTGSEPEAATHEAVLYFRPRAGRDTEEFFADARYGELWVGARPSLAEVEARTGLRCAHIDGLADALAKDAGAGGVQLRVVSAADAAVEALVAAARSGQEGTADADAGLVEALSELRLVKDDYEVEQMRHAVAATVEGFADMVRALPRAVAHHRGERVLEGAFGAKAREEGNAVGYDTIAAAGNHANTLHWIANDGAVRPGDLVLIDAGVEVDSLYTADVTRTIPVDGVFTEPQRRVYTAVLDAADAAFAVAGRPGARFKDVHAAAMDVIAARLAEWGLLPGTAAESLAPEGQFHRRWMVHGTSHHLGLDVHDCAQARREMYLEAELEPGMVFTIEPGLYFRADDLAVPAELRGIGVRIEDDVLVTADGVENLSAALPRRPDDVEAWMASLRQA
ncbi:aminopeptidase P family protein [Georgenia wangjunii]|uniref:aminopeptidase P family protein n=1 Tax=Georgenia wangjunii TaxID=3117730 RepID=UPI002F267E9F